MARAQSEAGGEAPKTNGTGKPKPPTNLLDGDEALEQLKRDACKIIDRIGPAIFNGAELTQGTERVSGSLSFTFNPGGKNSKSRFQVGASVTLPAKKIEHEVSVQESPDGGTQLRLYAAQEIE